METLTRWLLKAQHDSGLSQVEIAERLGVTQSWVSRLLSGEVELRVSVYMDLAHAIGVDPVEGLLYAQERTRHERA